MTKSPLTFCFAVVSIFVSISTFTTLPVYSWDLVMQDGWGDQWEFDIISEDNYAVYYSGQWRWQARRDQWKTGKASAAYIKEGTSMNLTAFYDDGDTVYNIIYPYTAWYDSKLVYRWYGVRHWVRDDQYRNNMYFDVKEGQIYNFNNFEPSAKVMNRNSNTVNQVNSSSIERNHPIKDPLLTYPLSEHTVKIGALLPLTGELQSLGESYTASLRYAQETINQELSAAGDPRSVEVIIKDTATNPAESFTRLHELFNEDVHIVLGPESSESAYFVREAAKGIGMLLLSCGSTAVPLSIADDNLIRLMPDDSHQARALVAKLIADGIRYLILVARTDIYGDGLSGAIVEQFESAGGTVLQQLNAPKKNSEVSKIIDQMDSAIDESNQHGNQDSTAVLIVLFDEAFEIMKHASSVEHVKTVKWYGTDSIVQSHSILADPVLADFSAQTELTCSTFSFVKNEQFLAVETELEYRLGYTPTPFSLLMYDAFQLAAHALLSSGQDDAGQLRQHIISLAETYDGVTTPLQFNEAGDRSSGAYDFWKIAVTNGKVEWVYESTTLVEPPTSLTEWALY
jgi:branched-chain amino acid transport system substrate-binding protein